jgi:hypothetical protein
MAIARGEITDRALPPIQEPLQRLRIGYRHT